MKTIPPSLPRCNVHFDTIVLLVNAKPSNAMCRTLKELCGRKPTIKESKMGNGIHRLNLFQPSRKCMVFIAAELADARVQLLEIAADFAADDPVDARKTCIELQKRCVQSWRRDDWHCVYLSTYYNMRPGWDKTGVVIYPRKSKDDDRRDVARLELRIKGSKRCKCIAETAAELVNVDPAEVLNRRISLVNVDMGKLYRAWRGILRQKKPPTERERRAGHLIMRLAMYEAGCDYPNAQALVDTFRGREWFGRRRSIIMCAIHMFLFQQQSDPKIAKS